MSNYEFPEKGNFLTMPDEVFDRCLSTIDKLNKEGEKK